ncbi:MAG: glucosaminidase domain-containing protein [Hyphomicrobiaceae bacterium]|nr:glucosaminidase domain-containing protein [Hyphomicrobiaceae bacterium]
MKILGRVLIAAGLTSFSFAAAAETLPPLKISDSNTAPTCATPGRIMAFLKARNPKLRPQFEKIAVHYMRHGEALGVRWDFALFQMVVETNALKFTGDVDWDQYNFAGLAATGGGEKGERFSSVSDGVKAHLQHLMVYAGMPVEQPVAERTRKVQEWRILDKWRRRIRGPVTFAQIGRQWAPGDRGYGRDIQHVADAFYGRFCDRADPNPDLLAEARGNALKPKTVATSRRYGEGRSGLGAGDVAAPPPPAAKPKASRPYTILNNAGVPEAAPRNEPPPAARPKTKLASAGAAAKFAVPGMRPNQNETRRQPKAKPPATRPEASRPQAKPEAKANPKSCRVWTASYGGQKAIIIRSKTTESVNYTVLDVNEGREQREAAAYIAAYAKGGKQIGTFKSQTLALEKAFKLCPNG